MNQHPAFFANVVGASTLTVVRVTDHPDGTRPEDVLGKGTRVLHAPDSERARSLLAAQLSAEGD